MSQLGLDFGPDAPELSREGEVYFCLRPPPAITAQAAVAGDDLRAAGVTGVKRPDTYHVSLGAMEPYQKLDEVVAKARAIADAVRAARFVLEFADVAPFGGPTAVLRAVITPKAALDLQAALVTRTRQLTSFRPSVGFDAHMTLAWPDRPVEPFRLKEPILWEVTEYLLVISRPKLGLEVLGHWLLD